MDSISGKEAWGDDGFVRFLVSLQFELTFMALVTSKYTQLKTELHGSAVEVNILIGVYSVVVVFPTILVYTYAI